MNKYKAKDFVILKCDYRKDKAIDYIKKNQILNNISIFNRHLRNDFSDISEYEFCMKYKPSIFAIPDCMDRCMMLFSGVVCEKWGTGVVYLIPKERQDVVDYIKEKFPHPKYLKQMKRLNGLNYCVEDRDRLNKQFYNDMENMVKNRDNNYGNLLGYQRYVVKERKRKIKNILK